MSGEETHDYAFKLVLLGSARVGKSCILHRITNDEFLVDTKATIGVEYATADTVVVDGTKIKPQIWDTAGQERFHAITKVYYQSAVGCLLVYDISDHESFDDMKRWMNELKMHADPNVVVMLIGNKCDLDAEREVDIEEANAFAKKHQMVFRETSAKDGSGVLESLETIVTEIYRRMDQKRPPGAEEEGSTPNLEGEVVRIEKTAEPSPSKKGCAC